MSVSNGIGMYIWINLIISMGNCVRSQTGGPNAVVSLNGRTTLDCQTSFLAASTWTRTTDGARNPFLIALGCTVTESNDSYYSTIKPGGNICRLIIANATMQQGGVYDCYSGSGVITYRSLVTVIDPNASVIVYNKSEVVESDQLNISCSISYTGPSSPAPSLRPLPSWSTSPEQIFTSSVYYSSINIVTLVATVTVQKPTVPIFQCKTVFEITGNTAGYNATAPQETLTVGSTPAFDVQFRPSVPVITSWTQSGSENGVNCDFNVLTCNSTGNPSPKYRWFDANPRLSDVISKEQNLSYAKVNHNYICEAYNTIRNVMYTNSANYIVVMAANSTNNNTLCETPTPDVTDNHLLRTILLAAILGGYGVLNIIATIVFIIYYIRKSNKDKLNARFAWLQNMLPCMNEKRGNAGCKFVSVILFIVMSLLAGIILFPILVAIANCSRRSSVSMGNSDIDMRDAAYDNDLSPNSKVAGSPSTAAHGDVVGLYDVIRHTEKTANDYTDATSNNAQKCVPYTLVRPNGNTADNVGRYYVS